jgi:hypothetical protein
MRRLIGGLFAAAVIVVAGVPGGLFAQGSGKTMNTTGVVSAVTPSSIAIKVKAEEMKFVVDKDTAVLAKGATHKSLAMKADGKSTLLTDFVKTGDTVVIEYHDMGSMKHAATINVKVAPPPK